MAEKNITEPRKRRKPTDAHCIVTRCNLHEKKQYKM